MTELRNKLAKILSDQQILIDEPMKNHTTFRVGGPADYFLIPQSEEEAAALLRLFCDEKIPYYVMGNGSNLLVSDDGYRGCILELFNNFSDIRVTDDGIRACAGALLSKVANTAMKEGLDGLSFASGIPGTIGGAVTMNAGAYGGEMKDIVESVRLYDLRQHKIVEKSAEEMHFGYRDSLVKHEPYVVLSANLRLTRGDSDSIREKMDELKAKRILKQPLEYPSAGSTFKRPEGYFAGQLIEEAGLKGFGIGGAEVSKKHSGFVINTGSATARDIVALIKTIRQKVWDKNHVELECEVCMLNIDPEEIMIEKG